METLSHLRDLKASNDVITHRKRETRVWEGSENKREDREGCLKITKQRDLNLEYFLKMSIIDICVFF